MTDTFDSRALRYTDCYGQRFMRTGTFPYDVVAAHLAPTVTKGPYTVKVGPRTSDGVMTQHTVIIDTVEEGDLVLWACPHAQTRYAVVGDTEFFGSPTLINECGFSHAFASAGEYPWRDANGGKLRGVVHVRDPRTTDNRSFAAWKRSIEKGALVMITGDAADPAEIDVVTGQTVYFAVAKGPGVTVTDVRTLGEDPDTETDRPKPVARKAAKKALAKKKAAKKR
jgi:plastocyanin